MRHFLHKQSGFLSPHLPVNQLQYSTVHRLHIFCCQTKVSVIFASKFLFFHNLACYFIIWQSMLFSLFVCMLLRLLNNSLLWLTPWVFYWYWYRNKICRLSKSVNNVKWQHCNWKIIKIFHWIQTVFIISFHHLWVEESFAEKQVI